MHKIYLFCISFLFSVVLIGQTTIATQDFETTQATPTLTYTTTGTGTAPVFSTGQSSSTADAPASANLYNGGARGYRFYNITNRVVTFDAINTSSYTDINFSIKLASFSIGSTGNGADAGDVVSVDVSPDNGSTWYSRVKVAGNNNARWSFSSGTGVASNVYAANNTYSSYAPTGGGARTSDGYTTLSISGLPSVTQLLIRVTLINDAVNESWIIDDAVISGTVISSPTKLAITNINPASPVVNNAFSVIVQSQNAANTASNVSAATGFSLSVVTGTGTLAGTLTGTIAAGSNQAVVTGLTYSVAENGVVLTATRTSGDALADGNSAAFNVLGVATQLAFVNFPASGSANASVASFTVEARRADNSVDVNYTGNITLSKASGTGNVTGTLSKAAVAGVATFNDIKFDATGSYTLSAASGSLTSATSSSITISVAPVTPAAGEILINQLNPEYSGGSDEYIELVNVTNKTFDLSTVAIKYQSAGGGAGGAGGTLSGTLAPYSYWLLSPNSTVTIGQTAALARDGSVTAGMSSSGGQIGLVTVTGAIKIDAVGYGATSGSYIEGTSVAAPSAPNGLKRVTDGVDNNTNSTDFTSVAASAIDLRNSTSRISNSSAAVPPGTYNRLYITGNSSLGGAVIVTGRLVFGNNTILTTTSANILKLNSTATITNASATSFVDGPLTVATASTAARQIPVGKAGTYKPVTITPTAATASEFTAEYFAAAPPTAPFESRVTAIETNEYWQIDRTSGTAPATVTLNYNSNGATWSNGMNPDVSDVISIVHLRSANNTWTQEYGTNVPNNTTTATLTTGTINDFSPFTFGYGPSVALPVTITSFTATKTATGNVLNWKVGGEINFSQYLVERSTSGNGNFSPIATIAANNAGSYMATDAQPGGYNYYRLKLMDKDGRASYSKTILIINQAKGFEITNVYPTVTSGTVILESYAATPVKATIRIINQAGQPVYTQSVTLSQSNLTNVNLGRFASGNYLLQVQAEGYSKTIKLVKQ